MMNHTPTINKIKKTIGKNTIEALRSGFYTMPLLHCCFHSQTPCVCLLFCAFKYNLFSLTTLLLWLSV